jgi:hypothetical protein
VDVGVLQALESRRRVRLRKRRHAPGADGRAEQFDWCPAGRQPLAVEQAVEGNEREALGPAGGGRDGRHVGRRQSVLAQVGEGARAGTQHHHLGGGAHG